MRRRWEPETQMDVASCDPGCSFGTQQKFVFCDVNLIFLSSGSELMFESR